MAAWARVDVLVLDDLVLRSRAPDQAADVLEVIEDRAQLSSTIVTTQVPVAMWHEALGEPAVANAILDRLSENVHASNGRESPRAARPTVDRKPRPRGPSAGHDY
jgi:DNA replication protein DnaC